MTPPRPTPEGAPTLDAILRDAADFVHEIYEVRRSDLKRGSDLPFGLVDYYRMETLEKSLRDAAARVAPEGREPPPEIAKLLTAYGNASFDCGAWDDEDEEPYADVLARSEAARANLEAALNRVAQEGR